MAEGTPVDVSFGLLTNELQNNLSAMLSFTMEKLHLTSRTSASASVTFRKPFQREKSRVGEPNGILMIGGNCRLPERIVVSPARTQMVGQKNG